MAHLDFRHALDTDIDLKLWDLAMVETMVHVIQANAQHLRQWLPWPSPNYGLADAESFIRRSQKAWALEGILSVGIWDHDRLVGGVSMNHVDWANRSTSLGYWLAESRQGRGIMTRACHIVVDDLIRIRGFNRIVIAVQPDNMKSRAIAERLHFQQEASARCTAMMASLLTG